MSTRDGQAIVYCDGGFATTTGKTAHGLVRRTSRYQVLSVIDASAAGRDAGEILDGVALQIPVVRDLEEALSDARRRGAVATHFVIGLAPDGGRLEPHQRDAVLGAIEAGLHVDSGLHDFLSDDPVLSAAASRRGVRLRDIRKTPPRAEMHFFSGKIREVEARIVAVFGTDAAIGKRTTSHLLLDGFRAAGLTAEMIGTGQTAWLQGVKHGIVLDSLICDFIPGELEHAAWSCWNETHADVLIIEGQGSLMHPAYSSGLEVLATLRPDAVVVQHAPTRQTYDGFPQNPMPPLATQLKALEILSGRPVAAVTVNHEGLARDAIDQVCRGISDAHDGIPVVDLLWQGEAARKTLIEAICTQMERRERG